MELWWEQFFRDSGHSPAKLGEILIDMMDHSLRGVFNLDKTKGLIAAGADLNTRDALGRTPIYIAVRCRNMALVDIMIDATIAGNYTFDTPNQWGQNAVQYMMTQYPMTDDNISRVIRMFDHGASPHTVDPWGNTFLMTAAKSGALRLVKYLVSRDVDLDAQDHQGKTAEDLARKVYKPEVAAFLQQERDQREKLRRSIEAGLPSPKPIPKNRKAQKKSPKNK